jgi:dienelactone hydrolase
MLCPEKHEEHAVRLTSLVKYRIPGLILLGPAEHPSRVNIFGTDIQISNAAFESDGHSITVQQFLPNGSGRYPAIIALHGSGGIREGWAEQPAKLIAGQGCAVFVVHYFERTGTIWADHDTTRTNFPNWMRTVGDAITFAALHTSVDPDRIGLLGFSLGAYLALSVASVEPRVKAVVEFFGGMPEELHGFTHMPPVLILHGEEDRVVPVTEATRLQQLLERTGAPCEMKLYPGAGHGFNGYQLLDAGQRTIQFLQRHL